MATGNAGFVYYHRHIYSLSINRWLNEDEIIHHIDGDKSNNNIENLKLTTKNEHCKLHSYTKDSQRVCPICNIEFQSSKKRICCSVKCKTKFARKNWPIKEWLQYWVYKTTKVKIAEYLGCSDRQVLNYYRAYNIKTPERGYWITNKPAPIV